MFAAALVVSILLAGIKIGGDSFVPRNVIFGRPTEASTVSGEGTLGKECGWETLITTELGESVDARGCVRYYYRTSATLTRKCASAEKPDTIKSMRITPTPRFCPDGKTKVPAPKTESRPISSGLTPAGKQQEIIEQPDGTKLTILSDETSVTVRVIYTDGTTDSLTFP